MKRVLGAVLLVAMSASPAAAQADNPTRAEILTSLASDKVQADYVVLLDTSGSMAQGNRYATAVQALGGLFEALPAEDRVALYSFDSTTDPQYLGPSLPPAELLGKLPPAPDPAGSTDLGQAMSVALQELRREGAAQVANVVIITDGDHDAPASSPYADEKAPAWENLRQQAKQSGGPALSVYAVPLGDGSSGAAVVKSVFDGAIVLAPADVQNLREYLSRSKARVAIDKARTVLRQDVGKSFDVKWDVKPTGDGTAQVIATLTSTTKNVPLEVENVRMEVADSATQVNVEPQRHVVEPGKSVEITGSLLFQPKNDPFTRRTVTARTDVRLAATVRSSWTAALKPEIDLGVDRELTTTSTAVTLTRTVGSSLFLPVFFLLALVLIASVAIGRRRRRTVLNGVLVVSGGAEPVELGRFELSGRRVALDGLPGSGAVTPDGAFWGRRTTDMRISYTSAPGSRPPMTGLCGSGGSLILGGLNFSHFENGD